MTENFQRIPFGGAKSGATLKFHVRGVKGKVTANALLVRENQTVGTWESIELIDIPAEEKLLPPGFYSLQITIKFAPRGSSCAVDVELHHAAGAIDAATLDFSGGGKDVARLAADVMVRS